MATIDLILKDAGYTHGELYQCEKEGNCNGMGAKGGIQWTEVAKGFPYFKEEKGAKLLEDLDLISDIHDMDCDKGGNIWKFLEINKDLADRAVQLFHWTTTTKRITIFILIFGGTTLFGRKSFNFHKDG